MKKAIAALASLLVLLNCTAYAQDAAFNGCKLADAKGKQTDARLIFSDTNKDVVIRVSDHDVDVIPYDHLDKFEYEYTTKHRVTEGAFVMVASLGAGAIVMMTKSKSHWLYIDYHDQNLPHTLVVRMDKGEYKKIFDAIKQHTGKDVEFVGKADKQKPKAAGNADKETPKPTTPDTAAQTAATAAPQE